tara:strand:+ start:165 stop:431 length:267 start_codon:yes stop_codon:yes gene_type:complete
MVIPDYLPTLDEETVVYKWEGTPVVERAEIGHANGNLSLDYVVGRDEINLYCSDAVREERGKLFAADDDCPDGYYLKHVRSYRPIDQN